MVVKPLESAHQSHRKLIQKAAEQEKPWPESLTKSAKRAQTNLSMRQGDG